MYGNKKRIDPTASLEKSVNEPIRQIQPTRVTDVQTSQVAVNVSVYNTAATTAGPLTDGTGPVNGQPWNAEVVDTDTMHDNAVNNPRLTIPPAKPGQYRFWVRIVFAACGEAGVTGAVKLRKSGVTVQKTVTAPLSTTGVTVIMVQYQDNYISGDYVDVVIDATGGTGIGTTINHGTETSYFIGAKQMV